VPDAAAESNGADLNGGASSSSDDLEIKFEGKSFMDEDWGFSARFGGGDDDDK
jgi:hypothetical protein